MQDVRFKVNSPQVIHESIDGEVIIINLSSGNYYSVRGSGAAVWGVIEQAPGVNQPEVVEVLAARFDRSPSEVDAAVTPFIAQLREEGLIGAADASEAVATVPADGGVAAAPETGDFEAPRLEKFTDMQDLVLLDPVHEVDATGWPQTRPDAPVNSPSA